MTADAILTITQISQELRSGVTQRRCSSSIFSVNGNDIAKSKACTGYVFYVHPLGHSTEEVAHEPVKSASRREKIHLAGHSGFRLYSTFEDIVGEAKVRWIQIVVVRGDIVAGFVVEDWDRGNNAVFRRTYVSIGWKTGFNIATRTITRMRRAT
jgi:hypothetical protein